jgi:RimJ/RimL family protein N-acetyltransferase
VGVSIVSFLLILTGYDENLGAQQSVDVARNVLILIGLVYAVCVAAQYICLRFVYPLDKNKTLELEKFQSFHALKEQMETGYEYFQIFDNTEFCGYCGIHQEETTLFLSKLYLKKEARNRHLSTKTIQYLKTLCQKRGLSSIWLTCNKYNTNTLAVYHHLGFETVRSQVADIGNGYVMDDYILECRV